MPCLLGVGRLGIGRAGAPRMHAALPSQIPRRLAMAAGGTQSAARWVRLAVLRAAGAAPRRALSELIATWPEGPPRGGAVAAEVAAPAAAGIAFAVLAAATPKQAVARRVEGRLRRLGVSVGRRRERRRGRRHEGRRDRQREGAPTAHGRTRRAPAGRGRRLGRRREQVGERARGSSGFALGGVGKRAAVCMPRRQLE